MLYTIKLIVLTFAGLAPSPGRKCSTIQRERVREKEREIMQHPLLPFQEESISAMRVPLRLPAESCTDPQEQPWQPIVAINN